MENKERIAEELYNGYHAMSKKECQRKAGIILGIMEFLGYRLIPELTVLSNEEMRAINNAMPPEAKYGDVFKAIAQAQLNKDREQLANQGGENE
uniref:Uncharacterized protein n=1 Tax=viral metagenome TaxID=1070528 RepID=A0A6M3JHZ1_9ZZZZ